MFVGVSTALTAVRRVFHPFIREGLKLYYRFTETFSETSPDFLLDGSTSFDGSNDYISIGDADNLSFGDGSTDSAFSISAWIKMDDATDFQIAGKGIYNSTGEWVFQNINDTLGLYLFDESVASTYELATYNTALTSYEGQWIHVACTYDGRGGSSANAGIKLYLNGSSVATTLYGAGTYVAMENLGADVHIGRYNSTYAEGSMANIGIWDRALSASEIESIYWRGSHSELQNTELTNLVSWYDLQGDVLDKQGSNDGTNNGATLNSDSYSGESPFKPRIQDIATPKMAVQLADGSTSFDGSDDHIQISDHSTIQNIFASGGTLSLWLKTNSDGENTVGRIADKANWFFCTTGESAGVCDLRFLSVTSGDDGDWITTNTCVPNGEWTHVALVYNGSSTSNNPTIYVNGSSQALTESTTPASTQTSDAGNDLYIGNRADGIACFDGKMANFSIHSSELTQSQVQELMFTERYQNLSSDLKTNLVSWYDLGSTSLGSELVTNGGFDTTDDWSVVSGTWVIEDGVAKGGGGTGFIAHGSFTQGKLYSMTFTVKDYVSGSVNVSFSDGTLQGTDRTANGTYTEIGTVTANNNIYFKGTSFNGSIDDVSIKEVQATDSEGSNEGSIYGATTNTGYTSSPHGVVDPLNFGEVYSGRALSFDGSNDYVSCGDIGITDYPITFSTWFNTSSSSSQSLVGYYNSLSSLNFISVAMNSGSLQAVVIKGSDVDTTTYGSGYDDGNWHHVSVVFTSATERKIYVDGVLLGTDTDSVAFPSLGGSPVLSIGRHGDSSPDAYFNGKLSSVKVFNNSLSIDEIRQLYTKPETVLPTGVSASNLKLDLPMQEGANSYVYDGSGNQNHGTITGATWVTGQEYGYQASLVRSNTPMHFDGSNDLVQISSNLSSNWTFSTWARADFTDSNWHELYDKNPSGGGGRITIAIVQNKFQMYDTAYRDSGWTLSDKNWHHYVITQTGTALKFYVDGSYQATVTGDGHSLGGDAHIGRYYPLAIEYWSGIINEMAFYDTALDADAITALYNSGVPLLPTSDSGNYDNSDNLTGYWRNDGMATWTDRANTGVASFDGINDNLTRADLLSSEYTMSAWVKYDAIGDSSWQHLFGQSLAGLETKASSFEFYYKDSSPYKLTGSWTINANEWVHIAVTNSSTTKSVYLNGVQKATVSDSSSYNPTGTFYVGNLNTGEYVDGQIAGTHVFNVGLTASEITELYNIDKRSSISGHSKFSNCIGSWLMGAGTGDSTSTIQDQTSNNNDLTVNGASLVGYNDGTASGSPVSIVIPEGSTEGRDNQGYYLSDTTLTSNNGLRMYGGGEVIKLDDSELFHLGTKDFTFEFWAKFNETSTTRGFFNYFKDANNRFHLSNYSNIDFWANVGGSDQSTQISNTRDLDWHHYVVTKESNTMKIYIDTSVVKTNTSWTQDINFTGGTFYIGVRTDDGSDLTSYNVDGSIDEFRIYHKALSSSEVTKNYNNGKSSHQ